jgi:hypothetical protein
MGMFNTRNPPNLPVAPTEYDAKYMSQLLNVLRLYFTDLNAVQLLSVAGLNLDLNTLPTEATLASLRVGDVYLDTTAGNVLKVKV